MDPALPFLPKNPDLVHTEDTPGRPSPTNPVMKYTKPNMHHRLVGQNRCRHGLIPLSTESVDIAGRPFKDLLVRIQGMFPSSRQRPAGSRLKVHLAA